LTEGDILHRTHARDLLIKEYEKEIQALRRELKGAAGRISFTCDMWSSVVMRAFLAVTLHY
ncbi:hypothetical protein C8Q80DRAFT_1055389, partial [Daedaleopsis nitida]